MKITVYNSLTNKIEEFIPLKENEISMYVCGPTVYNDPHIGNARPIVFFDMVHRFFDTLGYNVKYVSNFTDIDDKIIKKAIEEGKTEIEISNKYIDNYLEICNKLNCLHLYNRPRVTEWIDEIIAFIKELLDNDLAYRTNDNVYFRIKKAPHYGTLSNQNIDELDVGSRIEANDEKEDPRDFVLWKLTKDEGIKWDSPFGKGRPGWHTECCVMIDKIFGGKIDIHGGGNDLKFPHHENEIAQISALHHHDIANYWIHNGRVDINNQKMSKSLGNIILAIDLLNKYNPNGIRLMLLSTNYRQNINFSFELVEQSCVDYSRMEKTYISLSRELEINGSYKKLETLNLPNLTSFLEVLADDFNTSNALTSLQLTIKEANILLRQQNIDYEKLNEYFNSLDKMFYCFGFNPNIKPLESDELELVRNWKALRKNKEFDKADALRKEINDKGIIL